MVSIDAAIITGTPLRRDGWTHLECLADLDLVAGFDTIR